MDELRVMVVVGVMADLEASLRATAQAMRKATYGISSAQRAAKLKRRLAQIQELLHDPHVQIALDAALAVPLKLNRRDALLAAADKVGTAAYEFAKVADGKQLAAVDRLLPEPDQYKK